MSTDPALDESRLVRLLASQGHTRTLRPFEALSIQGDTDDDLYVVISGELRATVSLIAGGVMSRETSRELDVGRHGPGSLVGELTAISGGTRSTTLMAGPEGATIAVVAGTAFGALIEEHPRSGAALAAQARRRMNKMRAVALLAAVLGGRFAHLAPTLADDAEFREVDAGDTVFAEGDASDGMYLVVSGRLLVTTDDAQGTETVLAEVGRGQVVGELGLLDGLPRSATVTALRRTTLAFVADDAFTRLVSADPGLALSFARYALTRSLRDNPERRRVVTALVPAGPEVLGAAVDDLASAMTALGPTEVLTAGHVDDLLDRRGAAQARPGTGVHVRLTELFTELADRVSYTLAVADPETSPWTETVVDHADVVLFATGRSPDRETVARLCEIRSRIGATTTVLVVMIHEPESQRPEPSSAVRDALGAREVIHVRRGRHDDARRLARLSTGRGLGLVLGGGGARGFAHLGVIRALRELDVAVDRVTGASIGAVIGAAMCQDLATEALVPLAERQFAKLLDYTLPVVSLLKGKRIATNLDDQFGGWDIEDLWIPFTCVTTNLTRSRVEVHRSGNLAPAVRASVAIPGVLPPVPWGEDLLVDGGLLNNLPVDVMAADPSIDTVIAVEVAPPGGPRARSDFGLSVSGWQALRRRVGGSREYPGLVAVLVRSMLVGGARERHLHVDDGAIDLLLDLDLRGVGLLDFDRVGEVAETGYQSARPRLEAWLAERDGPAADAQRWT